MVTVFIDNKPIYLTDSLVHSSKANFFYFNKVNIDEVIRNLENNKIRNAYIFNTNIKLLFQKFKKRFKIIEAAGGLVKNSKKELLFIYRNGIWDLPKGKIENGENATDAAIREVEEETGVKDVIVLESLGITYHIYTLNDNKIFKITHWYKMFTDFSDELQPQLEEGITKVKWLNKQQVKQVLKKTYANIKLLLNKCNY